MAYITKHNSISILKKIDFAKCKQLTGQVYRMPIYFFGQYEINILLGLQELFKDPEKFALEYYIPIVREDKFKYVFEGGKPAYHKNSECDKLNSKYINFEIPFEIIERAKEQGGDEKVKDIVNQFRTWFKQYMHLLENDIDEFVKKLEIRWNVQIKPQSIERKNSGIEIKENLDLAQLENKIDEIIHKAGSFYKENKDKQEIIRRFQKYTFLAYTYKEIYKNDTGLTDKELKDFLKQYDEDFKIPIKDLLFEYYRVKFNPDLKFEGKLLEQLGFKSCGWCFGEYNNEIPPDLFADTQNNF